MKDVTRKERRERKENKKANVFNQKTKKGRLTPYKGRYSKHKGDIFSHLDGEI